MIINLKFTSKLSFQLTSPAVIHAARNRYTEHVML